MSARVEAPERVGTPQLAGRFVRGRFCELAARMNGLDGTEQYLLGMLSLLPVMLRAPMKDLAPTMPLRNEIQRALMDEETYERSLLRWLEHYERAEWAGCGEVAMARALDEDGFLASYHEAVAWTDAALYFAWSRRALPHQSGPALLKRRASNTSGPSCGGAQSKTVIKSLRVSNQPIGGIE